jgi:hypothetical protein
MQATCVQRSLPRCRLKYYNYSQSSRFYGRAQFTVVERAQLQIMS